MGIRYYSTQRPPAPGTYPRPATVKVLEVKGFCSKVYVRAIDRPAWGYIEYEKPLHPSDVSAYELVPGELTCSGCVNEAEGHEKDCCWDCNRNPRRANCDHFRPLSES